MIFSFQVIITLVLFGIMAWQDLKEGEVSGELFILWGILLSLAWLNAPPSLVEMWVMLAVCACALAFWVFGLWLEGDLVATCLFALGPRPNLQVIPNP